MPIDVSALSVHLRGTVPDSGEPDTWIAKAMKLLAQQAPMRITENACGIDSTALRQISGILFHPSSPAIDRSRNCTGSTPAPRVNRRVPDFDAVVARPRSRATTPFANAADSVVSVNGAQNFQTQRTNLETSV